MKIDILVVSELVPPRSGGAGRGIHDYLIRNQEKYNFHLFSSVNEDEYAKNHDKLKSYYHLPSYRNKNKIIASLNFIKLILETLKYKIAQCIGH